MGFISVWLSFSLAHDLITETKMSLLSLFDYKNPPTTLKVKVTPKAKSQRIKKEIAADGTELYRVYVTEAPEDGKANKAVIALIAKELGVPKSAVIIQKGLHSREKIIKIDK